ncbi:hypothetical protein GCK32_017032 [Trichostrongylus colubriformis]|uniref:Uncharacterized protein n=1 Tax=Trichostrongylus colubriformis TaxID=6319 RepID=A0AAN8ER56_TRICO
MSSNPRWWPYRISVEDALKRSAVVVIGVIVGANVVSYYWKPMREYDEALDRGKTELLRKYKALHDERLAKAQKQL